MITEHVILYNVVLCPPPLYPFSMAGLFGCLYITSWLYFEHCLAWTLFVLSSEYLSAEDFPEHIKSLVQKEKESEEQEKRQREIERNTCKVKGFCRLTHSLLLFWMCIVSLLSHDCPVCSSAFHLQIKLFCMHPVKMMESKLEVHKDKTLREATEMAYKVCCWFCLPSSDFWQMAN